jgi:hypothetical protein
MCDIYYREGHPSSRSDASPPRARVRLSGPSGGMKLKVHKKNQPPDASIMPANCILLQIPAATPLDHVFRNRVFPYQRLHSYVLRRTSTII